MIGFVADRRVAGARIRHTEALTGDETGFRHTASERHSDGAVEGDTAVCQLR